MGILRRHGRALVATALILAAVSVPAWATADEDQFLRTPLGPYRGRVVDAGSGQPVAGAGVFMIWTALDADEGFGYREAETNARGEFTIDASAIEQNRPVKALMPRFWIYRPGYRLYPDREREGRGASSLPLTKVGAVVGLMRVLTPDERTESFNDFVAVVNRFPVTTQPTLMIALMTKELDYLKAYLTAFPPDETGRARPDVAQTSAQGPCVADPRNPPPLAPPQVPKVPKPGEPTPWAARRGPYYGHVVDADTKTPIVGAVVAAVWLRRVILPLGATSKFYDACEVLTDTNGMFVLDGRSIEARGAPENIEFPRFSVFFPGYSAYGVLPSNVTSGTPFAEGDEPGFHGVRIGLVRLRTLAERRHVAASLPAPCCGLPPGKLPILSRLWAIERAAVDQLEDQAGGRRR